ncbi:MuDR family transposase isoform 2 [Gossypium australe]|uniref:MuDR family transposase isoform 2 n=1 Tax=Gossypium australe TaxID=47621 RepID=A0A5B6VTP7_9ROSI|nr:MuDR family transposase isoform 2 [Gossypium australe]
MATKRVIAVCQSGGEFETDKNGVMLYKGGDAHAIDLDDQTKLDDFKKELAEMFNLNMSTMSVKYFLPGNKKTLISISNDKDLKRLIKFHGNSTTVDVFVLMEENVPHDVSNMPASRSSRTALSEAVAPAPDPASAPAPAPVLASLDPPLDVMDDTTRPNIPLAASLDIVDATNHIDPHIDLAPEFSSILPLAKTTQQWQNTITGVGQRFTGVQEFRETLRKYAIAHQFAFRYKKNDSHRVTVKCRAEGCPWRIHASRLSTTQLICIKKMNPTHTCEGAALTTGHQATRSWVASIIKERLKVFPTYKPKDIVQDIKQEFGIQLNYFQAWRGKEIAREQLQGSYKDAYSQLPLFCERIMETNPGSRATFSTKEDSSFHRLFIAFHASLSGFLQGCRPLLFLDSIPLNSKYQGTLLAATAADGNDDVFPVAFSVVDAETDENWYWFLLELKSALSTSCPITFVADIQKGLRESISEIFKGSFHGYCLRYLTEQLIRDLKGQFSHEMKRLMIDDLYNAALAPRPEAFHSYINSIKKISLEAYNWIIQSEPQYWANSYFQGARYNHMASNFGELFYSWVSDAHELPITQMVDVIRQKVMELIYSRRAESDHWLTRLTPCMEEKLEKESMKVRTLQVLLTSGSIFEVRGDSTTEMVDMDRWDCSCKGWQLTALPCSHAIAVISCIGRSPYEFCSRYFTTESYRLTYAESIQPIPDVERPLQKDTSSALVTVTPPPTRRPPGRPTTKKVGTPEVMKRQLQCSRCKGLGHNKSTCKELL